MNVGSECVDSFHYYNQLELLLLMNTFIRQKAEETDRQADKQTNKQWQQNQNQTINQTNSDMHSYVMFRLFLEN